MKKGEIYEGIIEKVDFPNKGYVMVEDQKVLVINGMPGQKIRFVIQKKRSGRAQGRILEVLEKSPLEKREPVCSSFPQCGGCMYQTMPYEEQLHMKERQIRELLEEVLVKEGQTDLNGKADFVWEGIHGSPEEFCYRKKARSERHIAIKWNFLLEMNIRTGLCLWDFTKKEVPMMC